MHLQTASLVASMGAALYLSVPSASAQDVAVETYIVGASEVTLQLHPFLTEIDLEALRALAQSTDALTLFIRESGTYGAVAVAPGEGFLTEGVPAGSVVAISDLPSVAAADQAAREACDNLRSHAQPCVTILAVAPL